MRVRPAARGWPALCPLNGGVGVKSGDERRRAVPTNPLIDRLGIENPVIQGPMGGGPSTPELVAAVSNAGGLGSLGAAYLKPDEITAAIRRIKSLTNKPFNVNLFAGGYGTKTDPDPGPMMDVLAEIHESLGLAAPVLPQLPPDPFA